MNVRSVHKCVLYSLVGLTVGDQSQYRMLGLRNIDYEPKCFATKPN